jgi:hypothetical protein
MPKQVIRDNPFQNPLGEDNENTFTRDAGMQRIALRLEYMTSARAGTSQGAASHG